MRIDFFTLFPEAFEWFSGQRHVTNAVERGSELRLFNYRDTTRLSGRQVDDSPYGGGAGMVLRVDVVDTALRAAYGEGRPPARVIVMAPSGRPLDDALAAELAGESHLALLCGRYEGIDERVREHLADEAISVGPYVLAGGELAAMVVADTVIRKLPGALGHVESAVEESFSEALEGGAGVPALHPAGELPGLGRARGAALGRPRAGARVAAGAQPGRETTPLGGALSRC